MPSRSRIVLVHNLPSGDPTAPKEEITVPKDFVEAAQPLGLTVRDDLIIGRGRHASLRNLQVIGDRNQSVQLP
jgi:DNA repair protein RadC